MMKKRLKIFLLYRCLQEKMDRIISGNIEILLLWGKTIYLSMRFFSKFVFLCNLCFVASVILRVVENTKKKNTDFSGQVLLRPIESTLVVLGYGAILVNLLFIVLCFYLLIAKRIKQIPRWLVITNLVFFAIEFYYFFISNF
jgi:hypothetical protein